MDQQTQNGSRATTIEELDAKFGRFFDVETPSFEPQPGDIIVSPFPKCGTTWMLQITHGLRTRGSMDFDEINAVVPWIMVANDFDWDLNAPQAAEPRLFHGHESWQDIPKGARYIVPLRHYEGAIVSFYRFLEGWFFEPGTIDLESFVLWWWPPDEVEKRGYWYHLSSWWEQRHNPDVLLICYEDMLADLPGAVRRIASFMGIPLDDELLEIVTRQSSREFMLAHSHQFDSHLLADVAGKRAGLPLYTPKKVKSGVANEARYQLSPALNEMFDDIWREQIQSKFGLSSYEDLRQSLGELYA